MTHQTQPLKDTMLRVPFFFIVFFLSLTVFAIQPIGKFHVRGAVIEAESGKTIPYTTITLKNTTLTLPQDTKSFLKNITAKN